MDPVSALGAAAAGAQFVGLAVKTLLGAAKLFQGVKEDPKRARELLTWIEQELNSMQRLLHPDSPVFASFTASQYVQIAPCAINARRALDKVRTMLSPLVDDIDRLKARDDLGNRILLLWKSLFTMKIVKDIETNLEAVQMLNATLLRELQVCGFETQSLLCDQSAQVLSIVVELSKRDNDILQSMKQMSTLQNQTIDETKLSTNAILQTLDTMREAENQRYQELLRMQMAYVLAVQNMSRSGMDFAELPPSVRTIVDFPSEDTEPGLDSAQIVKYKQKAQSFKSLRCKCYKNRISKVHDLRLFKFKTDSQVVQICPLHGRFGQKTYSVETNLHPWIYASLQLSLGVLFRGRSWSISRPLNFKGTVKRSESPIFRLIDDFISSCSTAQEVLLPRVPFGFSPSREKPGLLLHRDLFNFAYVRLDWDSQKTRAHLAGVVRGIEEAVSSGIASCSDMDEQGCTLLTELTVLFAYLGKEILNVENEMMRLFQIAYRSKVDPTTRLAEFSDKRSYGVFGFLGSHMTLGSTIIDYASVTGKISPSFYEVLLDYEGLAESVLMLRETPLVWKAIISDPYLAQALGYDDLSLAVISRSLERLKRLVHATSENHSSNGPGFSILELALGWPEGLRLLIDNNCHDIIKAFSLACQLHDTQSATILLSAQGLLFVRSIHSHGLRLSKWSIIDILASATNDRSIFYLTAKELWGQKDQLKLLLLDPSSPWHDPYIWKTESAISRSGINHDDVCTVWPPAKLQSFDNILSSAAHCVAGLKAYHHQILYDAGFTDIDTWCEKLGTPLSQKCFMAYPRLAIKYSPDDLTDDLERWGENVLWLLEKGANPKIFSRYFCYHGIFVHHFLAQAQKAGLKLSKSFSSLLRHHHERDLHDHCKCPCSSLGCIPSYRLWRHSTSICGDDWVDKRAVARRLSSIQKWIQYWGYSGKDIEFIYRELCRHEVFERLEMAHLCCKKVNYHSMYLFKDRRQDIEMEDENSARNLRLLLQFYILVRKEYSKISIGVFWNFWWDNLDALLPPLETPTSQFRSQSPFHTWHKEYKAFQDDLDISRDRKWRAALGEAGYKDWDYQDVIRDHCTKMLLKAHAYRQRVAAWKQRRLVLKPRFGKRQPLKFLKKEPEADSES